MAELFTISNFMTLCMLTILQAVLGFDNLLYISIESKRVPEEKQRFVRQMGVGLAIILRIILLLVVMAAIEHLKEPFLKLHLVGVFEGDFNVHSLITLVGGAFILYTAMKDIYHLLAVDDIEAEVRRLSGHGVQAVRYGHIEQDALGIWTTPGGAKVYWFRDPDGNLLSLSQL